MTDASMKKLLIIDILNILRKYSDAEHPLSTPAIITRLKNEYGRQCERKAVARNIGFLREAGFDIAGYPESGKGYYLRERDFEEAELRLLIDGVLSSRLIPAPQARELIEKLKRLSTVYFQKRMRHVYSACDWPRGNNQELFFTIDSLDEAIESHRQVSFTYGDWGTDRQLHPRRDRRYVVNPYQMVSVYGRYYLIANYEGYDNITHYRVDKIIGIRLEEEQARAIETLPSCEKGFDLQDYINRSIHMMGGDMVRAHLVIQPELVGDVVDWFGNDMMMTRRRDELVDVRLPGSLEGLKCWAMQYGSRCEVKRPAILRRQVKQELEDALKAYRN